MALRRVFSRYAYSDAYSGGAARVEIKVPSGEWRLECLRTLINNALGTGEAHDGLVCQGINRDGADLSFTYNEPAFVSHGVFTDYPQITCDDQDTLFGKVTGSASSTKYLSLYCRMVRLD